MAHLRTLVISVVDIPPHELAQRPWASPNVVVGGHADCGRSFLTIADAQVEVIVEERLAE
jgi:hypothetical protein